MFAIIYLLATFIADLFKPPRRLEVENLFLRHQLNIALRGAPVVPENSIRADSRDEGESEHHPCRNPTTGIVGCCARAASGHVAAAPPMSVMNWRRLMGPCRFRKVRFERRRPVDAVVLRDPQELGEPGLPAGDRVGLREAVLNDEQPREGK